MDDTFTLNNQRVVDICKEMVKRKINVKWRCSGRVNPISKEMIYWMEKAGCIMISFGVETGSQRLLDQIGKNQTVDQVVNAFKIVYENSDNLREYRKSLNETPKHTREFKEKLQRFIENQTGAKK